MSPVDLVWRIVMRGMPNQSETFASFVRMIAQDLRDVAPRLVFCDWLSEQGVDDSWIAEIKAFDYTAMYNMHNDLWAEFGPSSDGLSIEDTIHMCWFDIVNDMRYEYDL